MNLLLLPSIDGQTYVQVVAYPDEWTEERALQEAAGAMNAARTAYPDEWSWEEIEEEMLGRGFTSPIICKGPLWDSED